MKLKVFTKTQWAGMSLISVPTNTRGAIRSDESGDPWEWVSSGKRVTARRVTLGDLILEGHKKRPMPSLLPEDDGRLVTHEDAGHPFNS